MDSVSHPASSAVGTNRDFTVLKRPKFAGNYSTPSGTEIKEFLCVDGAVLN